MRGASRVARSVKSVRLTQPAVRETSPCQAPYERCLLSTTAAGWRSIVTNRGETPIASAQRCHSGRNHDSRGSLISTWSASLYCCSSQLRSCAWTSSSRQMFAVMAQAPGRASDTWTGLA